MPKNKFIEQIERCLKNKIIADKHIRKLRQQNMLNTFFSLGEEEITILMYLTKEGQFKKAKELLIGPNAADVTIKNKKGLNALALAILNIGINGSNDLSIIDELLQHKPIAQLTTVSAIGTNLYIAVFHQRADIVKKLLFFEQTQLFIDITAVNKSPLHHAINENLLDIVEILLSYEPEKQVLQEMKEGIIPLHLALHNGNILLAKKLLCYVPEQQILKQTLEKKTVFDFAAASNCEELVEWLITEYPQVLELRSVSGFTPLHSVCRLGNLNLVRLILKKQSKQAIIADDFGVLPLAESCVNKRLSIIEELLKHDPLTQILHQDKVSDQTIIIILCLQGLKDILNYTLDTLAKNQVNVGEVLVKKDNRGNLPLFYLIFMSHNFSENDLLEMITSLLKWEPSKQLTSKNGERKESPLHQAITDNKLPIIHKLLTYDCPEQYLTVNIVEETPLIAALQRNKVIAKLLLEKGPVEQLDKKINELPALWFAHFTCKDKEITQWMLANYTEKQVENANWEGTSILHMFISTKQNDLVDAVLKSRLATALADFKEIKNGSTPLHVAITYRNLAIIPGLLESGANIETQDNRGWRAIHIACSIGDKDSLNFLIKNGANLNSVTTAGTVALHIAAAYGHLELIKLLVAAGVAIDPGDKFGQTPLFCAILHRHYEIVEFLLINKADPNARIEFKDNYVTPLKLAIIKINLNLLKILIKHNADLDAPIEKKENSLTHLELIIAEYSKSPKIYRKIKEILPILPQLPKDNTSPSFSSGLEQTETAISSRQYLLAMGYTPEVIEEFEEESKKNKNLLNQNHFSFQFSETKSENTATWLNGNITSAHDFIIKIDSPGSNNTYCYLDINNLTEQGCDIAKIRSQRLKFDGYHIKKLDDEKAEYFELIKLSADHETKKTKYTHELKINKIDRILLFCIEADEGNSSLYIGAHYIDGGFHTNAKINSFLNSNNSNSYLEIKWPIATQLKPSFP